MKDIIHFTLRNVSVVIVLGECLKYIFKGFVPERRIFVVANGVQDTFDKTFIKSSDNSFNILFLSNLIRTKGVFEVLKVVSTIASFKNNIKFIFAGEWEDREEEREAIEFAKKNNITPYVDFVGKVEGTTKRKLLEQANLFVLPTFYPFEGQPITILEAMAAGLPVISTNRGAITETIIDGENGFLVKDRNSAQLVERIISLISNPDLCKEMGRRSRQAYLKSYTKDIFINNLYNVLLETVKTATSVVKAKILFIAPLPPPYAGPEVQSTILLTSSLKNEFDLIHLCSNLHAKNQDKGKIDFVSSVRFINLILKMLLAILVKRPKVVYTQLSQNISGFIRDSMVIIISSAFGKKVILHFHGTNFENFYNSQSVRFRPYISFVLHQTSAFILQANWVKEIFSQLAPNSRIKVIYNPIQADRFSSEREFVDRQSDGIVKVFYMSYLSVAKGFSVLVKAIREIVKDNQNIEFLIAGGIINRERNIFYSQDGRRINFEDIDKIVHDIKNDRMLNGRVVFLNEITNAEEKNSLLLGSDIFVLPSYSEGCPMVILEAMAVGLPVIVTPVGALPEIIQDGENGFFVKIGDHLDLKEKILYLANNPILRKKMGNNNRRLIESRFSTEKIIPQFSDFFHEIISESFKYKDI
jgi:glycosyltransferase involved in cell wall biosynthesis